MVATGERGPLGHRGLHSAARRAMGSAERVKGLYGRVRGQGVARGGAKILCDAVADGNS